VVERYLAFGAEVAPSVDLTDHPGRTPGSRGRSLRRITFLDTDGHPNPAVPVGQPLSIQLDVQTEELLRRPRAYVSITASTGERLFGLDSNFQEATVPAVDGAGSIVCTIPSLPLPPGRYTVHLAFGDYARFDEQIEHAATFDVTPDDYFGVGRLPPDHYGLTYQRSVWTSPSPAQRVAEPKGLRLDDAPTFGGR
jgi:lipopolysaccharide transport system ATP-binding protein